VIAVMKPGDAIWDSETRGFGIRARARDKSFVLRCRIGKEQVALTLGRYEAGVYGVDQARKEAQRQLVLVRSGKDPRDEKKARDAAPTLAEVAERYLIEYSLPRKKPASIRQDKQFLSRLILPALGTRKVLDISKADVAKLHSSFSETPASANRGVAVLSSVMSWAESVGLRPDGSNPCGSVSRFPERPRERSLTPDELARLGEALANSKEDWRTVAAIRLLLFTGARLNEILGLQWAWIDTERGLARLPDSKTGPKNVWLPAPALAVLAKLPRFVGSPHVLPGQRPGKPFVGLEKPWQKIRATIGLEDVRLHDLRHCYASVAVSDGASLFIVGKLLGHRNNATTERYSHLAPDPARAVADRNGERLMAMLDGKVGVPAA
jgi:integrase